MLSSSIRLLRLLSLLQTRSHWMGPELAERLEVHPRTLRRDVDRLRQLGYPVHASSGVAGGYAFRAGQALPPLLLDDEEALAVSIALRTATAGAVGGIEEPALRALVKLEQAMPARLRKRVDALRSAILPLDRTGPVVEVSLLGTLASACRDQLRIEFHCEDGQGRSAQRSVEPQGVVHTGQRWYLVAWDRVRNDWRTFRIDRIVGEPQVGAHFAPRTSPDRGDLKGYVSRSISAPHHAEQARVVLHAPYAVMSRRIPQSAGVVSSLDQGQRCQLECAGNDSLVYWLMALDVEFEVLAPASLTERLRVAGERALRCVL
ncbi:MULTISPECIES: YafY family protein [Acidovorax]|uniref:Helix-turn-helix transcriptional regulator n=1 Tax=Acidovorax facilis TaxID=12917 RepID=A0ABV8DIC1_9BURK|nr:MULTISPECIES: YafY family protein [Acidovorax]KQB59652.1 DeoR faimly transcriptional regulator [Acidovorax sp. SD340]MBO1008755.1 YafY family transcriptional regulator [Acidovorax sp. SD340]MCO4242263.1 YafY family transcriptional regulator [Acidovorax facilis]